MDVQILTNELSQLAHEARRKHADVKNAVDKALASLKTVPANGGSDEIRSCPGLADGLIGACKSQNAKLARPAAVCIQRLAVMGAIPPDRMAEFVGGLYECSQLNAGMEIQLKVLQTVPVLVANYPAEIAGDTLDSVFVTTSGLVGSKLGPVASTATATIQQLVSLVYDRLKDDHDRAGQPGGDVVVDVEVGDETMSMSPRARDAFRVFADMCSVGTRAGPKFIRLAPFPPATFFAVVESILVNQTESIRCRPEQAFVLRTMVMPMVTAALAQPLHFSVAVRHVRLIRLVAVQYVDLVVEGCEDALMVMLGLVDSEPVNSWRRVLALELFAHLLSRREWFEKIYLLYDGADDRKAVVNPLLNLLVRVASERPPAIGLGSAPSIATDDPGPVDGTAHSAMPDSDPTSAGAHLFDSGAVGISTRWSTVRVACLDQIDKAASVPIPSTYAYTLVISCLAYVADIVVDVAKGREGTFVVSMVDQSWPAMLAVCSSLMYSTVDDYTFRRLVRVVRQMALVCGLVGLDAPRDAFMSFLGKTAVPATVIPTVRAVFGSAGSAGPGRVSTDVSITQLRLSVWSLACMRSLVEVAIELGRTLGPSWSIVAEKIQHIDLLSFPATRPGSQSGPPSTLLDRVTAEVTAELFEIGTGLGRLTVSTADYPDDAFREVVDAFCRLLSRHKLHRPSSSSKPASEPEGSTAATISSFSEQEYVSALTRLKAICLANLTRIATMPPKESGWASVTSHLEHLISTPGLGREIRTLAGSIITAVSHDLVTGPASAAGKSAGPVQEIAVNALVARYSNEAATPTDEVTLAIHSSVFGTLLAMVEHSGDSLGQVWPAILDMVATGFVDRHPDRYRAGIRVEMVSVPIGRAAFAVVDLICSDYLAVLPAGSVVTVVNVLFQFCAQTADLNMSLAAAARYWSLSDHLCPCFAAADFDAITANEAVLDRTRPDLGSSDSSPARLAAHAWAVLLVRLTTVVQDGRAEVRDSALQTVVRVFQTFGPRLSPDGWHFCCQHMLLKMVSTNLAAFSAQTAVPDASADEVGALVDTSRLVITGVGDLLAANLGVVARSGRFSAFWGNLVDVFTSFLRIERFPLTSAVFTAISAILTAAETTEIDGGLVDAVRAVWLGYFPAQQPETETADDSSANDAFLNYVAAFSPLYRLSQARLGAADVGLMIANLVRAIREADLLNFSSDRDTETPIQAAVMAGLATIDRTDDAVAAIVASTGAQIATLHLGRRRDRKGTFVAVGRAAISLMAEVCVAGLKKSDHLVQAGVISTVLAALGRSVRTKTRVPMSASGQMLWQSATTTAAAIISATLARPDVATGDPDVVGAAWMAIVDLVDAVGTGDCALPVTTEDISFDCTHFADLIVLVRPRLGHSSVPAPARELFCACLVRNSIYHPDDLVGLPDLTGWTNDRLGQHLDWRERFGRTVERVETSRGPIATYCLIELFQIVAGRPPCRYSLDEDDTDGPVVKVGDHSDYAVDGSQISVLAQATLPYAVLRASVSLLGYVSDQPLRGNLPMTTSVWREMIVVLEQIGSIDCHYLDDGRGREVGAVRHVLLLHHIILRAVEVSRFDSDPDISAGLSKCLFRLDKAMLEISTR